MKTNDFDWASGNTLLRYDNQSILQFLNYFLDESFAADYKYSIYNKELQATIKSFEEQCPELQALKRPFEVVTKYQNLQYLITTEALNQCQIRESEFIFKLNFRIIYRFGKIAVRLDELHDAYKIVLLKSILKKIELKIDNE